MATYFFKAVATDGKLRTGTLTGETDKVIARELRRQGLTPLYVGLEPKKKGLSIDLPDLGGGKARDVLFFTQELSTLLNAGVPLDRALQIVSELTGHAAFRSVVLDTLRLIKGGRSFADALAAQPKFFSELYVNMVRAGEASGSLGPVFDRLVEFERSRDELRGYILSALTYPALLVLVGLGSVLVLMNFVVPRFAQVFRESHLKMPLPTQILLQVSEFVQQWWLAGVAGVVLAAFGFRGYIATPEGRMWWDTLRLRIPLLGSALQKAETARFARAMSTLIANSVPLVQSIGIAAGILNNKKISGALDAVAQGVKRGEGLAAPLRRAAVFPPLAGHLLSVGEETGRLDAMFARMAEIYEADTRTSIKRFTSLFEPLVILMMGLVVGGMILSMLLAITSINEVAV